MKSLRCFCVCSLLLLKVSTGFGDLRCPENVSMDSLNTRYVLRWDWPHETAINQTVTFTTQYILEYRSRKANYEQYWTSVCVNVREHYCDFSGAEMHYNGLFLLRVQANTSQQSSSWVQIGFCPDEQAALGPPSSVKLSSVKGDLEIIITDPLSSTNQSMKTLLEDELSYVIQYWRRSEEPQKAKVLETKNNLVMLTELDRQTWYCVRVQSRDVFHNKSSVFSDTQCTHTEGQMPYWETFLYVLIGLLLFFLLVLLFFCFYKMFNSRITFRSCCSVSPRSRSCCLRSIQSLCVCHWSWSGLSWTLWQWMSTQTLENRTPVHTADTSVETRAFTPQRRTPVTDPPHTLTYR